jgi:glycine/D-amino acid oxidase-like deaminating enzyme
LPNSTHFDFFVLGAGLAGLSISGKLLQKGASVCLIDTGDIASGASGTPLGLVNPATGRFGTKTWRAEECYSGISSDLEKVQEQTPVKFYKKTGILRPSQDKKMASRMKDNTQQQDWPEGWCTWLNKDEIRSINPELNCVDGGMWLPKGLTVDSGLYLKSKADLLKDKGLKVCTNMQYEIETSQSSFTISTQNEVLQAKWIIYATGDKTGELEPWRFLPFNLIKGQLAIFDTPKAGDFDYSISALGYIASISKTRFIAGSTYEHDFDHGKPDDEGAEYLIKRLNKVYPALFEEATLVDQWAGVRASSPNRKPFLGSHPENEDIFVFAGLGSKGLMYSDYLGSLLADYITDEIKLPKEISISRHLS